MVILPVTTHSLQCRGFELDMLETSTTEVCESSFSFFLGEKVAGKGGQGNSQTREGLQESALSKNFREEF